MPNFNEIFLAKRKKKKSKYLKILPENSPCVKNAIYSKTSMTRRPIARLPGVIRTRFLSPYEILPVAQENKYMGNFVILSWNCMLCVLVRIASSR